MYLVPDRREHRSRVRVRFPDHHGVLFLRRGALHPRLQRHHQVTDYLFD